MKISQVFSSDYLKAADLGDKRVGCVIDSVAMELIGGQDGKEKENKPVVYFQAKDKGLVLNKTNASMIAEIAGTEETDEWTGIKIALYSTKVEFAGKRVDAIRVDYPAGAPKPPPIDSDDIPF